ncbi:MAG: phosphoglucosamine mutase [bacterium]
MKNKLFGTDGIRGIAGTYPLTESLVYAVGFHAGAFLKSHSSDSASSIIIGRDTRESGSWITDRLAEGLTASGMHVCDAGVITTPGISYLVQKEHHAAGAVISASHNPAEYNGIKFFSSNGTKLDDAIEARIEHEIVTKKAPNSSAVHVAKTGHNTGTAEYIDFLCSTFPAGRNLNGMKIVIDCAHGAGYYIGPEVLSKLGAEVIPIFVKPDGFNLNKNCGSQHPAVLQETVKRNNADCGFALDGDADRVIFTDAGGSAFDGDHVLALLAVYLKDKGLLTGNILVTTIMANLGLVRAMEARGIKVIQTAVGDRYVYESMIQHHAVLGGEQSGHIIIRDRVKTGDGMVTALAVLGVMVKTGKTLAELTGIMKKYPQILLNIPVTDKLPIDKISGFTALENKFISELGLDGRIVTRYSGTEHCLRIMIEGIDFEDIKNKAESLAHIVEKKIGQKKAVQ